MYDAGKNTQEHPSDAVFQQHVSVTKEGCGWGPCTRLCKKNVLILVGSKRKSWVPLETSPHLLSAPFLHPLISPCEFLGFVYVLGDKTQTRNGNGSERGWVCGAVLESTGCDSSTCIWHFAIYRLFILCSVWIPRGWFILTRESMAPLMPAFTLQNVRDKRRGLFLSEFPEEFPPPSHPPTPSCVVKTETFLWETLCLWHNSMVSNPTSSAFSPPPSLLIIHKLHVIASTIKATGRGKNWV